MSTDKVTYSFVKDQEQGNLVFRSKVNSFNLDHVTDKDIVSFYRNFSNYAAIDTGLLPVDGTGILAIRSAGNHTQVTYQHKPGMYYVNWGAREGDSNAVSYHVAQPYRIVIIDFVDNNLLGARTFYSPIPATHPGIQLYHVNLPNINCRGYRGNGVGWICLYHNQDWSNLPFNERLARALERCSGVEVYNDANMSETDGPRFYAANGKPDWITNPKLWEDKSSSEGFDWTLDFDLWIPIMVKGRDDQGQHYTGSDAVPLTLGDAIVGKYNAYYYDDYHPKPINALTNPNLSLPSSQVSKWFIKSYNDSSTSFVGIDPYLQSQEVRQKQSEKKLAPSQLLTSDEKPDEDDEDEGMICDNCQQSYDSDDDLISHGDYLYCSDCFNDNFTLCVNTDEYLHSESEYLYYDPVQGDHYDLSAMKHYNVCSNCESLHYIDFSDFSSTHSVTNHWHSNVWATDSGELCTNCITDFSEDEISKVTCKHCECDMPNLISNTIFNVVDDYHIDKDVSFICNTCSSKLYPLYNCITGAQAYSYSFIKAAIPKSYVINSSTYPAAYQAITDEMKSHDTTIFDEYLLTVDTVSTLSSDFVYGFQLASKINEEDLPFHIQSNSHYRLIKESALSALELSMQKDVNSIRSLIVGSNVLTVIPNIEPF